MTQHIAIANDNFFKDENTFNFTQSALTRGSLKVEGIKGSVSLY